jgi:hypothetical protein
VFSEIQQANDMWQKQKESHERKLAKLQDEIRQEQQRIDWFTDKMQSNINVMRNAPQTEVFLDTLSELFSLSPNETLPRKYLDILDDVAFRDAEGDASVVYDSQE